MQTNEKPLKQITSYLMLDVILDQNASGTVYKAKHADTSEPCLIKVITKERIKQDPIFHERIRQEEKVLQSFGSPRILKFHSWVETGNYYYFISEGSEEGTLEGYIGRASFNEEEILAILVMVLQGYYEFFRRNLPYNNLSSRTLFKCGAEYRLSLFYLPDYYEKMETTFKNTKPPSAYSAPESLEGSANSHKRDIWALGVLIYEMVFGKTPFYGDNVISLFKNIEKNLADIYKNIDKTNKLSMEFKGLLKKMLDMESKRLSWQELVESSLLKSFKNRLETFFIKDYDFICDDIMTGKITLKQIKSPNFVKNIPTLNTDPIGIKKEALELFEGLDGVYGVKAKLLLGLEIMYTNWLTIFNNTTDPNKFSMILKPQFCSPKKQKGSPKKKGKAKALSEKILDEPDNLQIDEEISVNLPQSSSFMQKRLMATTINRRESESSSDLHKEILPKVSLKKTCSKEEKKMKEKKTKSAKIKDEDSNITDTLKIMKPTIYPQLPPHDKDSEKARMSYLKSLRPKNEALKPILEMSVEESATLDTLTISIVKNNFQDVMKEYFYRYLHENEILEFLYNTCEELNQVKSGNERDFPVFCFLKLIMMRFHLLKFNLDMKINVFNLDFWKEIVNLDIYQDVKNCIVENQNKYQQSYDKAYLKAKNFCKGLNPEQLKFLNGDLNIPHSEFKKNFDKSVILIIIKLYDEAKDIEKREKRIVGEIYGLLYKMMFCLEISKNLSFIKLDLKLEFDIVEFQERFAGLKQAVLIEEVESYKNKLLEDNKNV